ncbi:HesA/MoeB/ThiF family protein [Aurantibacter sp.]|uniref:HesA/MoeB/ThiF family protein n=1 Tax=Aurantibacter sp. TaxID=2807103 RepID=UPI003263BEDB
MNSGRYNRQNILKGFGPSAQQQLTNAKVLVIGAGGLGIPVLTYLNAMGIGTLGIVEQDSVSESNLHRQVIYTESDIGRPKIEAIQEKLMAQNSQTKFVSYDTFLVKENALKIIADYDLVVDASDNFPTRYLVNDACVILNKPFVYGALHGFEGQISVFNYMGGPTYRCLFPEMPKADEVPNCNEHGVLGILPGIIGNLQALETIKVIANIGEVLSGKLLIFSALEQSYQKIKFKVNTKNLLITELLNTYEWQDPCEVVPSISANKIQKLITAKAQIIDLRTNEEYSDFHLAESVHIPLNVIEANLQKIDFSVPVYLLCQSGKRSEMALKKLQKKYPMTSLYSISGGLNQYLATCS